MNGQNGNLFLIPSLFVGIGGWSKLVFPRLEARLQQHYGFRPDPLELLILDFDDSDAEIRVDGQTVSIRPYLASLPKKPLLDTARKLRRRRKTELPAYLKPFENYVLLDQVRPIEGPGLNLHVQNANLAWRLVWESHVFPAITTKLRKLHPDPHTRNFLEREGIHLSNRAVVWVVAGGGSTTGPSGLVPVCCELRSLLPQEVSLHALVFTPQAYWEKSEEQRRKGAGIFRATMECLLTLFENEFDQPYGLDGHRIRLEDAPFDHCFVLDGTRSGGRGVLKPEELADLVAIFLARAASGAIGERISAVLANLNHNHVGGKL